MNVENNMLLLSSMISLAVAALFMDKATFPLNNLNSFVLIVPVVAELKYEEPLTPIVTLAVRY